jgi:hypothetical protein
MRLTRMTVLLPVLLTIAACAPAPQPGPVPPNPGPATPPVPDTCGAAPFMALVGGPLSAFDAAHSMGSVRVIGPGMMVTQDYSPSRINISHDDRLVITRIDCG